MARKKYGSRHERVGKVRGIEIWLSWQMVYAQTEKETHKILWEVEIYKDHSISARKLNLILINKKKRTCDPVDFGVPANYRVWILPESWKNAVEHEVTVIAAVVGAIGTVPTDLEM